MVEFCVGLRPEKATRSLPQSRSPLDAQRASQFWDARRRIDVPKVIRSRALKEELSVARLPMPMEQALRSSAGPADGSDAAVTRASGLLKMGLPVSAQGPLLRPVPIIHQTAHACQEPGGVEASHELLRSPYEILVHGAISRLRMVDLPRYYRARVGVFGPALTSSQHPAISPLVTPSSQESQLQPRATHALETTAPGALPPQTLNRWRPRYELRQL